MLFVNTCKQENMVVAIGGGRDGRQDLMNWLLATSTMSILGFLSCVYRMSEMFSFCSKEVRL